VGQSKQARGKIRCRDALKLLESSSIDSQTMQLKSLELHGYKTFAARRRSSLLA